MFLPITKNDVERLGWKAIDIILITGDTYIDSPHIGVAIVGKVLLNAGYRVAVISQPDVLNRVDICRFGEPVLFWGITSGCVDSMISNYTPLSKKRKYDDLTAGGLNVKRPDMAVIAYSNLIRRYFKQTKPIVLGGIEASLRRISHYHFWSNSVRRSVLFDAKADILVYGMGEKTVVELAERLKNNKPIFDIRGICYISKKKRESFIDLPDHDTVKRDKHAFIRMFHRFYKNQDPLTAAGLNQKQDTRYLIHNPPQHCLTTQDLDRIYGMDFERDIHPRLKVLGEVRALNTIQFAIVSHRGCFGECNFCSIAIHQGRGVVGRSEDSIVKEVSCLTRHPKFKGIITDVGGPTANMYGMKCQIAQNRGACSNRRCLTPMVCKKLNADHSAQIRLLQRLRNLDGVRKIFIGSGVRYDLIGADKKNGQAYLELLVQHHISGQLKVAPEHSEEDVLYLMGKPTIDTFKKFVTDFYRVNRSMKKKQFLTCYFIAAYPGCTQDHMVKLKYFIKKLLHFRPEQVQIFTPSPSTLATLMYYTKRSNIGNKWLFVEKNPKAKDKQKRTLLNISK